MLYDELITIHDPAHIDKLYQLSAEFDSTDDDEKTFVFAKDFVNVYYNKHSLLSCQVSVGSCVTMINHLLSHYNDIEYGVTLVRPPGRHCNADTPLDFCLVHNLAIASNYVYNNYPHLKTCIIDIDIHHGNGTQDMGKTKIYYLAHCIIKMNYHPAPIIFTIKLFTICCMVAYSLLFKEYVAT